MTRQPRVLLVEDSRTARAAYAAALATAGFEMVAAGDATEALDVLAQRRFDVILADYQLPGLNGLELLAALRGADSRLPLVLYSASMTAELAVQARDFRVAAVLEQPVGAERIVEAVRGALKPEGPAT